MPAAIIGPSEPEELQDKLVVHDGKLVLSSGKLVLGPCGSSPTPPEPGHWALMLTVNGQKYEVSSWNARRDYQNNWYYVWDFSVHHPEDLPLSAGGTIQQWGWNHMADVTGVTGLTLTRPVGHTGTVGKIVIRADVESSWEREYDGGSETIAYTDGIVSDEIDVDFDNHTVGSVPNVSSWAHAHASSGFTQNVSDFTVSLAWEYVEV